MLEITEEKINQLSQASIQITELLDQVGISDKYLLLAYLAKEVSYQEICLVAVSIQVEDRIVSNCSYLNGSLIAVDSEAIA
jgi:hypothetical protein